MKKVFIAIIGLVLITLLLAYFLLPTTLNIQFANNLPIPARMANRALSEKEKWQEWWKAAPEVRYDKSNFTDAALFANTYRFALLWDGKTIPGIIRVIETNKAECSVLWAVEQQQSASFWQRLQNYFTNASAKKAVQQQAVAFSAFASNVEAVYGMKISEQQVKDTILVSTRRTFDHAPDITEVYEMVDAIQTFIAQDGAIATNHPMLHVDSLMRGEYVTMVGLPVNKDLNATPPFVVKRMVPGKILEAEVRGGLQRVKRASIELQHYAEDYQRVAPAIPFELMVTNRMQEKDSNKWVTKIYYPVF